MISARKYRQKEAYAQPVSMQVVMETVKHRKIDPPRAPSVPRLDNRHRVTMCYALMRKEHTFDTVWVYTELEAVAHFHNNKKYLKQWRKVWIRRIR